MIKFISHPYPCSLSKNPIPFTIYASDYSAENSIYPSITLTFNYQLLEGRFFYFQFINPDTGYQAEARFLGSTSPDLDGFDVPANASGAQTVNTAYVQDVAKYMKANREMSSYYSIEVDGLDIILTAKQAVQELSPYNFYMNDESGGGLGDPIEAVISDKFWKAQPRDGHRVNLKVYFEKEYMSNHFEVVSSQTDTVDNNGNLTIDIASIIDSEIRNSFETPPLAEPIDPAAANKTQKAKVIRRFYIEASELWKNMVPKGVWAKSETRHAHFGGVSMDDFSRENPFSYILTEKMMLSWWPNKKRLYEEQKDWISYMNVFGAGSSFTAKLNILYKDGTNDISSLGSIDLEAWETMIVPVGYNQLNIPVIQDLNKEVFGWEIIIEQPGEVEVAKKKFLLIQANSIFTKTLVYLNSFSVPESFVTTGFWDNSIQTSGEIAAKTLKHDYKSINGQDFIFTKSSRNTYTARSGLMTKKEKKALSDLLNVAPVFLIDKGIAYPVIIERDNYTINNEEELMETLEFQITKSMQLSNVSEMIKKPTLRLEESCGMFTVFVDSDEVIDDYQDLKVYKKVGNLFETISHDGDKYELVNKIEEEELYIFSAIVVIQGVDYILQEQLIYSTEKASFLSPIHNQPANITVFEMMSFVDENVFIDLQSGNETTAALVTNTMSTLGGVVNQGYKNQSIKSSCLSNIQQFRIYDQSYSQFDLVKMKKLRLLEIANCSLTGPFSISNFKKLEVALLEGNNFSYIEVGLIVQLYSLDLKDNMLSDVAINALAKELWKYRKLIEPAGGVTYVYLSGNPGTSSLSQETLDIINGTGAYNGDGLVDNDILFIY